MRFASALVPGLLTGAALLGLAVVVFSQIASLAHPTATTAISPLIWRTLGFTFFQASLSTILSLGLGLVLAWSLFHQSKFMGRSVFITLLSSALVLPTLVAVLGLITVLGRNGWINSAAQWLTGYSFGPFLYGLAGILIAHVYLNASFAVRSLLNRFEAIPEQKLKLARSLGLSPWQRFKFVEWPMVKTTLPGIGATIFLLCFTSFAIVLVLGGSPKYNTLEVAIYEAIKLDFDLARALNLALVQLIVCAGLVFLAANLKTTRSNLAHKVSLRVWPESARSRAVQWCVIVFAAAGFLSPLIAIFIDGLQADFQGIFGEAAFQRALVTSLCLAIISSIITVLFSLFIANARRTLTSPERLSTTPWAFLLDRLLAFSGSLYLTIPSLVLGLGFFLLARQFSGSLSLWATFALLCANVLMALPFATAILVPAMGKTALRYDRLCFSLGIRGITRWRLAEWPFLRVDIFYVAALSFCLSLGDLGVIALFGSQDFATLPWYLYQKLGSYQTHDAAGVALILLMLILAVFATASRVSNGGANAGPR